MIRLLIFTLFFFIQTSLCFADDLEACKKAYDKLYQEDEVRMSVFFGYFEHDDTAYDYLYQSNFISQLTSPCFRGLQLCEFDRDLDDADTFYKTIKTPDGKLRKVRFQVFRSANSTSDSYNKGPGSKEQKLHSFKTAEKFKQALQTDQVVIYSGHARRGTGPGFKPMTNGGWIEAVTIKPALNEMLETLKSSKKTPQILGMSVCEGERHYGYHLQKAAPKSSLLLPRQTMDGEDGNRIAESTFNSLLSFHCQKELKAGIAQGVERFFTSPLKNTKTYEDKLPRLYGFFEPIDKKFEPPKNIIYNLLDSQLETSVNKRYERPINNSIPVRGTQ